MRAIGTGRLCLLTDTHRMPGSSARRASGQGVRDHGPSASDHLCTCGTLRAFVRPMHIHRPRWRRFPSGNYAVTRANRRKSFSCCPKRCHRAAGLGKTGDFGALLGYFRGSIRHIRPERTKPLRGGLFEPMSFLASGRFSSAPGFSDSCFSDSPHLPGSRGAMTAANVTGAWDRFTWVFQLATTRPEQSVQLVSLCTSRRDVLYNSLRDGEAICTTRSPRKPLLGSEEPVLPESSALWCSGSRTSSNTRSVRSARRQNRLTRALPSPRAKGHRILSCRPG